MSLKAIPPAYKAAIESQLLATLPPIQSIDWIGLGSVRVAFVEPQPCTPLDQQHYAPFLLNWTFTQDDDRGRVRLNIPAAVHRAALEVAAC